MKAIKILLFLLCLSLFLFELTPDKDNAILISEYEIKCSIKTVTYKIYNNQAKKYFLLIKSHSISEFALYEGDTKLSEETHFEDDYFFPLKGSNVIYLVVNTYFEYCLSFILMDSNSITLKNNEEFLHPIVNYPTNINTIIQNVKDKHFIIYAENTGYSYYIYVNGKKHDKYSGEIFSLIPEEDQLEIKIQILKNKVVTSIRYISIPYSNITSDIFKCIDNNDPIQSYFIKNNDQEKSIFISYNNNSVDYYENDELEKKLNNFIYSEGDYFLLTKDKGCFQILYLYSFRLKIKEEGSSYKILNSEKYSFDFYKYYDNKKIDRFILSIYSSENNFINELTIENKKQNLNIEKEKNLFVYNIEISPRFNIITRFEISVDIKFNLNSKDFIDVILKIRDETDEADNTGLIIFLSILFGILAVGIILFIIEKIIVGKKREKEERLKEMKLLAQEKFKEKTKNFYSLIQKDYTLIEKVCLLCTNMDKSNNNVNYNNNEEIDAIDDFNKGNYLNLYDFISPKECCHLFHDNCIHENDYIKSKIKNPERCNFCRNFMTLDNMKKFGCFFSEKSFIDSCSFYNNNNNIKRENIKIIEDIFYSLLDSSWKIDRVKKEKLLKLKDINKKFLKKKDILTEDYFTYYKINYTDDLDEIEKDLDDEIIKRKKKKQKEQEILIELEEQNRHLPLLRCSECKNTCLFCHGNIKESFPKITAMYAIHTYCAHNKCILDKYSCCICNKNEGRFNCDRICYYCQKKDPFRYLKCFYCKRDFDYD